MRIEALEAYDIEPALIETWRESIGPRLLPVQERAVKEFGLFGGGNLVVFSPTSSGKTFIGEMAAVKAARANGRVFYLVPQRALAEEKFREFRARYGPIGLDVVVSSRDHREHDAQIRDRQFELAIVVFEKLRALLVSQPNLLADVGLVVIDELQMLTDAERGPTLELLLTKLRMAPRGPRIIGLSAVLGQADLLTRWLGAKLLMDERRPVELRKGVLCLGEYRYREHNSGLVGAEPFRCVETKDRNELMLAAAEELVQRGEQALVFVPDRATAVTLARVLASRVRVPIAEEARDELRESEETQMREVLAETLESGVAFHHADMTSEEREIVEGAFRAGTVRALVATSTLSMGVNLPTRNVILDGRRWETKGPFGRPLLVDLTKSEFENMSGRAGRLAFTKDFGRSILVTQSRYQADSWFESYIERGFEDITPTLKHDRLEDLVLDLVASNLAKTRAELGELLLSSFTGTIHWSEKMGRDKFLEAVSHGVDVCTRGGLVREKTDGTLSVTKSGKVAAARSLGAETAAVFANWANTAPPGAPAPLEVLTLLGQTVAGDGVYVRYTYREDREVDYKGDFIVRVDQAGLRERAVFHPYVSTRKALEDDEAKAVKKALMMQDWIDEVPTREIERSFETWAGSLKRIGEEYGWLCEGLAAICAAEGWPAPWRRSVERLGDRLVHGLKEDALGVAKLRVRRLGRSLVPRLRDLGLLDLAELRRAGPDEVKRRFGHAKVVTAMFAKLDGKEPPPTPAAMQLALPQTLADSPKEYPSTPVAPVPALRAADAPLPMIAPPSAAIEPSAPAASAPAPVDVLIDLPSRRLVLWGATIIAKTPKGLPPQLFYALAALALQAGEVMSMADLAKEMQDLGRLPRKPVAPEARDLRYRLLRSLRSLLGTHPRQDEVDSLIENVSGFGLRLGCSAQVVRARDELIG
jgi:helicase